MFEDDELMLELLDESFPSIPILTGHVMVYGTGTDYNCGENDPARVNHEAMNRTFDSKYPHLKSDYESQGTYQMMTLPIIKDRHTARLCEYSHDVIYMMLEQVDTSEIDRFINSINTDEEFRRSRPPFRFKYLNVCCISVPRYPSSTNIYC